jgi:hypothetical protein
MSSGRRGTVRCVDSLGEEIRNAFVSRGLLGQDAHGPVPVSRSAELEATGWEAEVLESAAVQALMDAVLRLAEEIDALRADR